MAGSQVDDVDEVLQNINEQNDAMEQINAAMGQPIGPSADIDEDDLEAEFNVCAFELLPSLIVLACFCFVALPSLPELCVPHQGLYCTPMLFHADSLVFSPCRIAHCAWPPNYLRPWRLGVEIRQWLACGGGRLVPMEGANRG